MVSPTWGALGCSLKPGSYHRDQQLLKRQDVVAALQTAIADRDIEFWTRVSQTDWSKGQNQKLFVDPSRYDTAFGIDIHTLGALKLVPMPTSPTNAGAAINGRGAVMAITVFANGSAAIFFPWTDGNYRYSTDAGATWNTATTPAGAKISDIATSGNIVFFSFYNSGGVWQTVASAPAALTQYDTGATQYSKLLYDPLRKNLYGIMTADTGAQLHRINAGAGPTTIFSWDVGRVDALENYQGNVVVSWNQASYTRGAVASRLYTFTGTLTAATVPGSFADMPGGTFVTGLRTVLGTLFICGLEGDVFAPATDKGALYFMVGTTGPTRIDDLDASYLDDTNAACFLGYPHFMLGQGAQLLVCTKQRVMRYDIVNGGVSRSLGDSGVDTLKGFLQGIVAVRGTIFGIVGAIGSSPGGVANLNPSTNGLIAGGGFVDQQLTSSRFDLGLPYVDKYWYALEVICDALTPGQSIRMEYSLDDGLTWTVCSNSPLATLGTKRFNFLVQQVSAHLRYRLTPIAAVTTASPVIHSVAARFAPSNPSAKVWQFSVLAADNIRLRNNAVSDVSGQDILTYLFNVAKTNETITFYDANEPLGAGGARVAHTAWVMQASQDTLNTGGTYNQLRQEGELALMLWEIGS